MQTITDIRLATTSDHPNLVTALSQAFYDDPVFRWIYPDEDHRRQALPGFFGVFTEAIGRHGASHTTGDATGAALWVPPGEEVTDDEEAFGAAILALSPGDEDRILGCFEVMAESHPHEPHWYLNFLGVVPEAQGQGVGSAMLEAAAARSDATGVPAYLEATSDANRRLYERHGFVVTAELPLPDGGPSLWPMWRR
jgi:ribosomal protein S18 acetylase RimI-like enzyme